jgi:AhpD family alkylhydroperoxidase
VTDSLADFNAFRGRMNDIILNAGNLTINRFFALDHRCYEPGALGTKTKEMLGLVSSLVLRCDDCITYHVVRCHEEGTTREEFLEIFSVGLVVRRQHRHSAPAPRDGAAGRTRPGRAERSSSVRSSRWVPPAAVRPARPR